MSRLIDVKLDDSTPSGFANAAFEGEGAPTDGNNGVGRPSKINGSPQVAAASKDVERQSWDNPIEFLLSCIAMSVGLGNIWRFPYVAYENGGGAFLIPYFLVLVFIGRPLYFFELLLGQFSGLGSIKLWNVAPLARGVGYAQAIASYAIATYYTFLMAISVFYFFASFQETLPWALCPNATEATCYGADANFTIINATGLQSSSSLYFTNQVVHQVDNLGGGLGDPDWKLSLCLLFCWISITLTMIKGVASSGKVAYFTALFPYVVLFTLLIRGVTLPGSAEGIKYFLYPQWEKLLDGRVWYKAVAQCFFSLSVGAGPIATMASYNPYQHNIYKDSVVISLADTFTSILAGITIFSVIGNLAYETGQEVTAVVSGGTGLAFKTYPFAIAKFPGAPQLFSTLFFLMLFTLALGSSTSFVANITSIVKDAFPNSRQWVVVVGTCLSGFLIGLVYTTPGGLYMVDLVDQFAAEFVIFIIVIVETAAVCWIYGLGNLLRDIKHMLGFGLGLYWKFSWAIFVPLSLTIIFIYFMSAQFQHPQTGDGQVFPQEYLAGGWILATFALLQFPAWAGYAIYKSAGLSWSERFRKSLEPSEEWGPADANDRMDWMVARGAPVEFSWIPKFLRRS